MSGASPFVGKWKFNTSENMDEFMQTMGAPWIIRKMADMIHPDYEVCVDKEHYKFVMLSAITNRTTEFDLDKPFEEETLDGKKYTSVCTKESETKLVQHSLIEATEMYTYREVKDNLLIITMEGKGAKTVRTFLKE